MSINNRSIQYTGPLSLPENYNRAYFFIVVTTGSVEIEFGDGGGRIPLAQGNHYCPYVCPTSTIRITGTGTYVLHTAE